MPAELARARTELVAAEFTVEILDNQITVGAEPSSGWIARPLASVPLVGDTWTPTAPATTDPLTALADW